ncbi:MAG: restriction endonuclease [Candidatus Helarchaeota archaeon]
MNTLKELAYSYFKSMGYDVKFDVTITGTLKNSEYYYDMIIVDSKNNKIGIKIKDWGRSIGINAIRHFHEQIENSNLGEGILIGRNFSGYAKNLSKNYYKVKTISRNELIYHLGI